MDQLFPYFISIYAFKRILHRFESVGLVVNDSRMTQPWFYTWHSLYEFIVARRSLLRVARRSAVFNSSRQSLYSIIRLHHKIS